MRRLLAGLVVLAAACSGGSDGERAASPRPAEPVTRLSRLHAEADPVAGGRLVDADGRTVVLRGVNVNALAEYWDGTGTFPTVFPVEDGDPAAMAELGWNAVRLLVSWSRVEPEPGRYDERYLDEVAGHVERFAAAGLWSIVDFHQDAWGPSLAGPADEVCPAGQEPALGWDGAPEWATLDGGAPRCSGGVRELSPAVRAAWQAFLGDAAGPGGVGIQARYLAMLGHVAGVFAGSDAVAGIDLVNEPNAFGDDENAQLSAFYERAVAAVREGEAAAGGGSHVVLFEPSALWSATAAGPPPPFEHDGNVAYAPHLYEGGFTADQPITRTSFETARAEAAGFGGVPVVVGEWGTGPERAAEPGGGYFGEHQRLQDEFGFSATLWTWRESCGDPHKVGALRDGEVPEVWGLFDVDCRTNEVRGERDALAGALRRGWVQAGPGLAASSWDPAGEVLDGSGSGSGSVVAAYPCGSAASDVVVSGEGLEATTVEALDGGGCRVHGRATGGPWRMRVTPAT